MNRDELLRRFLGALGIDGDFNEPDSSFEVLKDELASEAEFALGHFRAAAAASNEAESCRLYVIFLACEHLSACHLACAAKQVEAVRFMLHGDSSIKAGDVS